MGIFPVAQGQLTHNSLVQSCQISNPFEIFMVILLTCKRKEEQSKIKELEWTQDFLHYNHMEAIYCHGNQSSNPI